MSVWTPPQVVTQATLPQYGYTPPSRVPATSSTPPTVVPLQQPTRQIVTGPSNFIRGT